LSGSSSHSPTEDVISNSLEGGLDTPELLAEHGEVRLANLAGELEVSRATAVSGLAARLPERDRPELGGLVARWCGDISAQLGFRPLSASAQEEGTGA
jgi:hypothetical protein